MCRGREGGTGREGWREGGRGVMGCVASKQVCSFVTTEGCSPPEWELDLLPRVMQRGVVGQWRQQDNKGVFY